MQNGQEGFGALPQQPVAPPQPVVPPQQPMMQSPQPVMQPQPMAAPQPMAPPVMGPQPVAPPQQPTGAPQQPAMGQPAMPVAPQGKKKTGLIIGIIAGVVIIVGGVLATVLFILPGMGGGMTCSKTSDESYGATMSEQHTFYFGGAGGTFDKMDMKMTFTVSKDSIFGGNIDTLYQSMSVAYENSGIPNVTVNKRGDSVVVEAKGLKIDDTIKGTSVFLGTSVYPSGGESLTRDEVKKQMEDDGYKCK